MHDAVRRADASSIETLRAQGLRPVHLDARRRSPLDLLDAIVEDPAARQSLRMALLHSRNPDAPPGYVKPEVFHGSPWGLEIMMSGELKGGVNDPKGGSQSLEGKVFLSDRTPASEVARTTRPGLRGNARVYAGGNGTRAATAAARGFQHRATKALLDSIDKGRPLNHLSRTEDIEVENEQDIERGLRDYFESALNLGRMSLLRSSSADLLESVAAKLSSRLQLVGPDKKVLLTLAGENLTEKYKTTASTWLASLERGKAPFLALINDGRVVPVVLGFTKIANLKTHTIKGMTGDSRYSYQDESHPLSGSPLGGRLKEIEVNSLQDLATFFLGTLAKGFEVPGDVVFRVKQQGRDAPPATYLTADQWRSFKARLVQAVEQWEAPQDMGSSGADPAGEATQVSVASLERLQVLNARARAQDLAAWVPPPTRGAGDVNFSDFRS